jgi:hypothetical protein
MAAQDKLSVPDLLRQFLINQLTGGSGNGPVATDVTPLAKEVTLQSRNGGGKSAFAGSVTSIGDNTIVTPPAGQSVKVFWVYTLTNPDSPTTLITVKLGAVPIYTSYGIAHWEPFVGAPNGPLIINLSAASNVAVTVHYTFV